MHACVFRTRKWRPVSLFRTVRVCKVCFGAPALAGPQMILVHVFIPCPLPFYMFPGLDFGRLLFVPQELTWECWCSVTRLTVRFRLMAVLLQKMGASCPTPRPSPPSFAPKRPLYPTVLPTSLSWNRRFL